MRMKRGFLLTGTICLSLTACSSNPHKSIVGDWQIATDEELARDVVTLSLRKENGTDLPETLSYALQTDGLLTIEQGRDHAVCCYGGIDKHLVDQRWRTRLSEERALRVRRMLARLRPRELSSEFPFALPKGCSWVSDSRSWASVSYVQEKVGGVFIFQPGCDASGSREAKRQLERVMIILPSVPGAAEFLRQS